MRAVIQRVKEASVRVNGNPVGSIGYGMLILLGIEEGDGAEDHAYILKKSLNLRIFDDQNGVMNKSVKEVSGEALIVSQFTLLGDCKKGNRPSYSRAAAPDTARRMYEDFVNDLGAEGVPAARGEFGAHMEVSLVNDGPVTILLDSRR